jgi:hypothetical protein
MKNASRHMFILFSCLWSSGNQIDLAIELLHSTLYFRFSLRATTIRFYFSDVFERYFFLHYWFTLSCLFCLFVQSKTNILARRKQLLRLSYFLHLFHTNILALGVIVIKRRTTSPPPPPPSQHHAEWDAHTRLNSSKQVISLLRPLPTQERHQTNICALSGIRFSNIGKQAAADLLLNTSRQTGSPVLK